VAPNRDVGVQLNGDLLDGVLSYSIGAFDGVVDGGSTDGDNNDDKDLAGRIFVRPLAKSKVMLFEGLGLGVAGNWGEETGPTPSYKTAAQNVFFSYVTGVAASGKRSRISPQAYWSIGPFGLLAEYIAASEQFTRGAIEVVEDVQAWQVAASFLLTGEKASFNGVAPKRNFDPRSGEWGAFEIAARYDEQRLDLGAFDQGFADRSTSAHRVRDFVIGLNWYLNRSLKVQLDYARSTFAGGAARGDREPENAILARIQLYF
jgi:phosphate-selective porin OprO/OprP